jgi:hypothetical protein
MFRYYATLGSGSHINQLELESLVCLLKDCDIFDVSCDQDELEHMLTSSKLKVRLL